MSVSTRIPKYRCHKTGQAFVQIKNQRIYLGKHGTEKAKKRTAESLPSGSAHHRRW